MSKAYAKALAEWAKGERDKLPADIKTLLKLALWDLYYGPIGSQEDADNLTSDENVPWHGYSAACDKIKEALEGVHTGDVWIDTDCDEVMLKEPEAWEDDNPDFDPDYDVDEDDEDYDKNKVEEKVWIEPNWENIYKVDAREVVAAIVGDSEIVANLM